MNCRLTRMCLPSRSFSQTIAGLSSSGSRRIAFSPADASAASTASVKQRTARAGRVDHRLDPCLDVIQSRNRLVGLPGQHCLELGQVLAQLGGSPASHAERSVLCLDASAGPYQRESGHRHCRQTSVVARLTCRGSLPQSRFRRRSARARAPVARLDGCASRKDGRPWTLHRRRPGRSRGPGRRRPPSPTRSSSSACAGRCRPTGTVTSTPRLVVAHRGRRGRGGRRAGLYCRLLPAGSVWPICDRLSRRPLSAELGRVAVARARREHVDRAVAEPDVRARPRSAGPAGTCGTTSSAPSPRNGRTPSCWWTTGQAVP